MCGTSYFVAALKIAASGRTLVTVPSARNVKPEGWFIQPLAVTTENAPPMPESTIGTPDQKWAHGDRRVQP